MRDVLRIANLQRFFDTYFLIGLFLYGCGYRYYVGDLRPMTENDRMTGMVVKDDGTVVFVKERLEIGLRPMTDEELNRQFASYSTKSTDSANPYTFGNWKDPETGRMPSRFTVFHLKVKNYTYPKMQVNPLRAKIVSNNGREYRPMSLLDLDNYYLAYAIGYAGNKHELYGERTDILKQSLYQGDVVFSGQEVEGYIVFPVLHEDVKHIRVQIEDVILRFDFRSDPVETVDIEYAFEREIGRVYSGRS